MIDYFHRTRLCGEFQFQLAQETKVCEEMYWFRYVVCDSPKNACLIDAALVHTRLLLNERILLSAKRNQEEQQTANFSIFLQNLQFWGAGMLRQRIFYAQPLTEVNVSVCRFINVWPN